MNDQEFQDAAERYFAGHPTATQANWRDLSAERQAALLRLGALDAAAFLGREPDRKNPHQAAAIYEQALWLILRPDDRIAAESIDGVGSRSYRAAPAELLAERARALLEPFRRPPIRLQRG